MTTTLSPLQAHERIVAVGVTASPDTRVIATMAVGEWCRQGDVMLIRINDLSADWLPTDDMQLAPGTTQGSRHIVTSRCRIRRSPEARPIVRLRDGRVRLLGPQIQSAERLVVSHPEHAHMDLPPGCYQVSYQTDIRTQEAVRD